MRKPLEMCLQDFVFLAVFAKTARTQLRKQKNLQDDESPNFIYK